MQDTPPCQYLHTPPLTRFFFLKRTMLGAIKPIAIADSGLAPVTIRHTCWSDLLDKTTGDDSQNGAAQLFNW